jgi:biofilm PGA synthesis N-glycosyltransferase PgaC
LHDHVSRKKPKLGEIVAFRNIIPFIPTESAVDELSIQAVVTAIGLRLVYEPSAVVYNRGPETVRDFINQRRRIFAGHLLVAKQQGYTASTMNVARIIRALVRSESRNVVRAPLWAAGTVTLEATARCLGYYDVLRRRPHHVWSVVQTTKKDLTIVPGGQESRGPEPELQHASGKIT